MNENNILAMLWRWASQIAAYIFGGNVEGITNDHLGIEG